ncbi:hypothetical protein Lepto7376_3073 [[Leptolyngbya] sp. PCC 7376]|uniref:hypothetical protein n=1 Tax=[Leptolyngbya] sp. PCC 7376 TaxID=111781 RepID=UPI00029F42EB|nr:hypothetical protein [[Leptolyngbya] sp. PCC 7376]AFY39313.1 hypothetical protein Lepto7376_3073 [[Leptolyngbya] sp. PCC 7376]
MLQSSTPTETPVASPESSSLYKDVDLDVQQQLTQLEEIIFDSPHIPLTGITMVEEEKLLDQLDLVRASLPKVIEAAMEVLQQKAQIIVEAEDYAEEIMAAAERRAAQLLDEMPLVRQAEQNAEQMRQDAEQECLNMRQSLAAEVEENRRKAYEEIREIRELAIAESDEIQEGADQYANQVLSGLEGQLIQMLNVVRNGRQQLQPSESANTEAPAAEQKSKAPAKLQPQRRRK